jgi:hypothetical protein
MNKELEERERILTIMGMARNARLGEEFHEMLINSGASIEESKAYIDAIFNSYSDAVATSNPVHTLGEHIELFTHGYCKTKTVADFLESEIALFIGKVYGKLTYTHLPRPNFLKVFVSNNEFVITENIFYDRFPGVEYIGSIVPGALDYDTERDERGGSSPLGKLLANAGYALKGTEVSASTMDKMLSRFYISSEFDVEGDIVEQQTGGQFKSDKPAELDKQQFQITAEYYNSIVAGDKWHRLDFLDEHVLANKRDISYLFHDNHTISNADNNRSCLQRMTDGNAMSRHFDSNTSGVDNYLFNSITWITEGEFKGRELILGKRSTDDLMEWLDGALNAKDNLEAYGLEPKNYSDTAMVKPESFKTVLVNSFNPIFYHGVAELEGTGSVYTIINDFQPG